MFSSNFWKRCGKSIKGWAKLRTWLRRRRSRKKEKKPHYSVLLDIYLNNFTWLGWFVREIDSHRTRNIQTHLKKICFVFLKASFVVFILNTSKKSTKKRFTGFIADPHWPSILVLLGCYDKCHRPVPYNNRNLFCTVLKAKSPRLRCQYEPVLVKTLFQVTESWLPSVSTLAGWDNLALQSLFSKGINPIHLLIPSL